MSHELWRLRESLYNTPLYCDQETLNSVVSYLTARNNGEVDVKAFVSSEEDKDQLRYAYDADTQTAVMNIMGPLTYKPVTFMGMDCGGQSYTALKEDMEDAISRGVKTVVFNVDSGGGYAFGMIQTAQYLRELADENGVEILAYVEGRSASAAYGLTSIADQIIGHPDASLGSVGVIIELMNDDQALKKEGYERSFIYAGKEKQPFANDGSFRKEFLEDLQEKVDDSYEKFTGLVSEMRNLPLQAVKDTEAAMFSVDKAISLGLADMVLSPEDFYQYLASRAESNMGKSNMNVNRIFNFNKKEGQPVASLKELQALAETQEALLQDKEAALVASLEQITTLEASVGELTSKLEALQAFAEEHEAAAKAAQAEAQRVAEEAAQAKIDQRKASLKEVLAEDQVEATYAALSSLDDASFSVIVSQYAATKEARAEAFKAVGSEGVEQESLVAEHDSVDAIRQAGVAKARERYAK